MDFLQLHSGKGNKKRPLFTLFVSQLGPYLEILIVILERFFDFPTPSETE